MRRPFFWPALGLSLGIVTGKALSFPRLPLFLFVLFLLPLVWSRRGKRFFLPLFLLALAAIGMLRIEFASTPPQHHLVHFAKGEWVSLQGRVDSLPEVKIKGKRKIYSFILEAENVFDQKRIFELTGKAQVFLFNPEQIPAHGNRVRIQGRLELPKRPSNPGEFDYRSYLADQGIYALLEGYSPRALKVIGQETGPFARTLQGVQSFRDFSAQRLDTLFSPPVNGLLKALILGIRKGLPENLRDDFIKTGTSHLIAISGMNITLVAGSLFFFFLVLGLPQKGAALAGLLAGALYVFLSGAGIPAVRAGWMAGLFFTGLLLEREKDLLNSLFFAFSIILAFDPAAFFQVGFQLSFLSVFSLAVLARSSEMEGLQEWLQTIWVLVGTFPLCVAYFSVFSWSSVFANLLAIPLFHLGVLGGFASFFGAGIPWLRPVLVGATSLLLKGGLAWIHFWAQQPWGYFHLKPPSASLIVLYYVTLALIYATVRIKRFNLPKGRPLLVSCWLLVAACFFFPPKSGHFSLTILSAGQNELLHVEFPGGKHWLVNAGRGAPSDQARWILASFLRKKGIKHLQGVVITDLARRHVGGLPTLLDNFTFGSLLAPIGFDFSSKKIERIFPEPGTEILIENRSGFRVIDVAEERIFLGIVSEGKKFLLLPTWNQEALKRALARLKSFAPLEVLILPAWGEPSISLWEETLLALRPRRVVFPRPRSAYERLLPTLQKEQISSSFVAETGALRFDVAEGHLQGPSEFFKKPADN